MMVIASASCTLEAEQPYNSTVKSISTAAPRSRRAGGTRQNGSYKSVSSTNNKPLPSPLAGTRLLVSSKMCGAGCHNTDARIWLEAGNSEIDPIGAGIYVCTYSTGSQVNYRTQPTFNSEGIAAESKIGCLVHLTRGLEVMRER
jgi:hypothetical protein